jgi:citrate lyase subunit beta/citryl-CoA lyase
LSFVPIGPKTTREPPTGAQMSATCSGNALMSLRSMLFVPADSEKKLARGADSGADALILDLEDAVAPARKPAAREMARAYLDAHRGQRRHQLWIRINPLDTEHALPDLAAIVGGAPDGLMLPKCNSVAEVRRLADYLSALEVREGVAAGSIKVMIVATETATAMFNLGSYAGAPRLVGMTWGAEDLATSVGAISNRDEDGRLTTLYQMARSLCVCAAASANVQPLDTAFLDFRNPDALRRTMEASRRDGFRGALAIHPDQVGPINETFTPSAEEVAWATRVTEAFAAEGAGVISLDGKMLDAPHLRQAEAVLALAKELAARG